MVWLYWSLSHLPRQDLNQDLGCRKAAEGTDSDHAETTRTFAPKQASQGPRCGLKVTECRSLEAQLTSNHPMFLLKPSHVLAKPSHVLAAIPCSCKNHPMFLLKPSHVLAQTIPCSCSNHPMFLQKPSHVLAKIL
jgi:hypothetical protein